MIRRVIDHSLQRRVLFLAISAAVLIFGVVQLDNSRVENLPEFHPPFVEVQTEALGLSAFEVEQLITVPLEADLLNGVAFVEDIRSQSMPGLSSIIMTFEPGTDILDARQLVQERLTQAAGLPNVSRAPAMVQPLSSESRVMMIGITSDELSLVDLGVLARWTIRPKLLGVDGVANVAVWGQREQQLQVLVDLDELAANDVPLQDVVNTAGNALWVTPLSFLEASTPGVGGFIDGPNQRVGIRHVPAISQPEDLAGVVVDGRPDLVIGDLATVVEDHQPLIGDALVGDENGLYLVVERFPWANTVETTAAVDAAMAELEPGLPGVRVDTDLFRPASYVERAIDNVQRSAVIALVLVAGVILLLLGSWRAAAAALLSLVVSLAAAGIVLMALDLTINSVVLLGLGIVALLVVDDSVRGVDELRRRSSEGADTVTGIQSGISSMGYVVAVLVVALAPSLFMGGVAGEFVPIVGLSLLLGGVVAMVVAAALTPALASWALGGRPVEGEAVPESTVVRTVGRSYEAALGGALRMAGIAVAGALVLVIAGAGLAMTAVDRAFVPEFRQTDLVVSFDAAAGLSLPATRRAIDDAARELADVPGVERVGTQVGRAILSDEVTNVNTGEIWLSIDPDADYDTTLNSVRRVVDGYPGFGRPTLTTYANDRLRDELQPEESDLVMRIYGEDPEELTVLARDLLGPVAALDGVENARAQLPVAEPAIEVAVDLDRAREAQVKAGDVRRAAATVFAGIEVGSLFEEQKVFEVVVWSEPQYRTSISDVESLLVDTPTGERIPLRDLADVQLAPNERIIERDAVSRYVDIVADVPGGDVAAVQAEIREIVEGRGLPFEYHVGFVDTADGDGFQVLAIGVAAAITIILLLQALFTSWRLAGILILTTAAAMSGCIVAVVIAGGTYSIGSMAGLVAVAGLSLRSGIGLLKRLEALQLDHGAELDADLVATGARQQLVPTIIGHAAVAVATLPFIVVGVDAGLEVVRPFAIAVLGGTAYSLIVATLVLPPLYLAVARSAVPHEDLLVELPDEPPLHRDQLSPEPVAT